MTFSNPDGAHDQLRVRNLYVPRSRDDGPGAGEVDPGETAIRPFVTINNNNGDPGYRLFVSTTDPALVYTVWNGDIWVQTP